MTFTDTRQIAKKPSKRQLAKIDREIEAFFYRHGRGVSIPIMELSKITAAGRAAASGGSDAIEAAVIAAIAPYREPALGDQ